MRIPTFLLLALLSLSARADFTFVHATDTHVSLNTAPGNNAERDAAMFREISALTPRPAFVAITGDVCEIATPTEYAIYQKTIKELTVPLKVAPGNHDVRWNPLGKEGYRLGTNQPLYQSWDHENVHFVLLDPTVLLQHWGHFAKAQLDWLRADLERVGREKPVIIGFHHWIGRASVQVDNEQELLDLVAPYNVVLWLQGHGHSDVAWNVNGTPAIMAKGLYQGSYHLIEVTTDALKVKRRSLGKADKEIVRDKSVPATEQVVWSDLMTVPLAKRPALSWTASATVDGGEAEIVVHGVDDKTVTMVEYRIDGGKFAALPLRVQGDHWLANVWSDSVGIGGLTPGRHVVTAQVTLFDGRQYQKPIPITVSGAVSPAWSANVGGAVQSHLARTADALYVSTMGNDLVSLDPKTGKENWRFAAGDSIFSTPVVQNDIVYFGAADHHVYAVDTKTHQPRWKFKTNGAVLAGPALAKNTLCVGSVDQFIYGLDATTGKEKWKVKGENMYQSNTASDGERFFVGGWDNTFRAIDAETGKVAWEKKVGRDAKSGKIMFYYSPAISSPAVGSGKVFVTSNDGVLHAFDAATGDEIWSYDGKKLGYSSPLYHDGRVYVAIGDEGKTFALDAGDGKLVWTSPGLPVIYDSSFAFANGKLFIGSVNGTFNALDAATGQIAWQYHLGPGHVFASPTADDQNVYIGSLSGKVTALPSK